MTKTGLLISWLNSYFQSETHKFWEGKSGEFYLRLTGQQATFDMLIQNSEILKLLKQVRPGFGIKMRPKLDAFIRRLEVQIAKQTRGRKD